MKSRRSSIKYTFLIITILFGQWLAIPTNSFAQMLNGNGSVELNGDTVEYSVDGNVVTADGNVSVIRGDTTLYCDHLEFHRDSSEAMAEGNVRLVSKTTEITGNKLSFNFETMTGDFYGARLMAYPYYGEGRKVSKVDENKIVVTDGYITTSDFDKPEFRLTSKKIDVYPEDKMVARRMKFLLGKVPIMYIPRYTQSLKERKPCVIVTPGYDKEWGTFLLSDWCYYLNENFKGTVHLDYRLKRDLAWGIDLDYKTPNTGSGIIRTYYMNERKTDTDYPFQKREFPTVERERFKVEWRHKWKIDDKTNTIMQYYKLSDKDLLKDYFESEHDKDSNPDTFFLLTRAMPVGTFSYRTDVRVNRFEEKVERLPELRYDLSNQEIGETGIYLKNRTTFSNLVKKLPSPSEVKPDTKRFDVDNELSYPMKVGIFEFKPFVGGQNTYYSKASDPDKDGSIRGLFKTGATLSAKFYRIFDTETEKWGLDINRLRHIITPTISYQYTTEPTVSAAQLDQFDGIDALERDHEINFSLENKLQTKRNDENVELLRSVISAPFRLKEDPVRPGFSTINLDTDFRPADWLTLYFDSSYDTKKDHLNTANFDLYINGKDDKWSWGVGKRFNRDADDQITTEFNYRINKKWSLKFYDRFDVDKGEQKEYELSLTRDLHAWIMDISFNRTKGEGSEIYVIFTLKAHPEVSIDAGTSFNKRKADGE